MSDQRKSEKSIFLEALVYDSEADRQAYLDSACGEDTTLREGVEELIRAHEQSGDLLDAAEDTIWSPTRPDGPAYENVMIGPYRILERIGSGAMGTVLLAEQTEPFERRVAIKVVRPELVNERCIARFESERRILGRMQHPGIATVFEGGQTAEGVPYFAMELVRGQALTAYCDEKRLSLAARLRLFAEICDAVQHAHQKGVIHRDLKPSNILVADQDGVARPKVIDFGIAKVLGSLPLPLDRAGTLAYMSPEQADPDEQDIDTRSDVYSLGAVLYELLSGSTPIPKRMIRSRSPSEILAMVRESRVEAPSDHLSAAENVAAENVAAVARNRSTTPRRLRASLRGDLDQIARTCLARDVADRYGSAGDLAADIRRHLRHEPLTVRRWTVPYWCGKFARRHRVATVAGVIVLLLLLLTAALGSTLAANLHWSYQRARRFTTMFVETVLGDDEHDPEEFARAVAESWRRLKSFLEPGAVAETERNLASLVTARLAEFGYKRPDSFQLAGAPFNQPPRVAFTPDLGHYAVVDERNNALKYVAWKGSEIEASTPPFAWPFEPRFLGDDYLSIRRLDARQDLGHLAIYRASGHADGQLPLVFERPNAHAHDMVDRRLAYGVTENNRFLVYYREDYEDEADEQNLDVAPHWPRRVAIRPAHGKEVLVITTKRGEPNEPRGVIVWTPTEGSEPFQPEGFRDALWACWTPNGRYVATASKQNWVQLWDFDRRRLLREFKASGNRISGIEFDPAGRLLAVSTYSHRLKVFTAWDGFAASNPPLLHLFRMGTSMGRFSDDGRLALVDADRVMEYEFVPSRVYENIFVPGLDPVTGFQFVHSFSLSADERRLLVGGNGWAACEDLDEGYELWRLAPHDGGSRNYARYVSKDRAIVVHRSSVDLLSLTDPAEKPATIASVRFEDGEPPPYAHASRVVGTEFAAATGAGRVRIFRVSDSGISPAAGPFSFPSAVNSLDLSPDGRWLAIGGRDGDGTIGKVRLIDRRSGELVPITAGAGDGSASWDRTFGQKVVAFAGSDRLLIGSAAAYELLRLDADKWVVEKTIPSGMSFPAAAFDHQAHWLALVDRRNRIELRRAPDFDVVLRLTDPFSRRISELAFDARGENLYAAGGGGVRRWKLTELRKKLSEIGLEVE